MRRLLLLTSWLLLLSSGGPLAAQGCFRGRPLQRRLSAGW